MLSLKLTFHFHVNGLGCATLTTNTEISLEGNMLCSLDCLITESVKYYLVLYDMEVPSVTCSIFVEDTHHQLLCTKNKSIFMCKFCSKARCVE